ncbi:MAG: heat-inducible transcription repressor HrcA [Fimbriimonadaceae bacterium]|nr:MAG: heat-inducible transcription repressor HrcA [Fimbriimonadaceae bacterium]
MENLSERKRKIVRAVVLEYVSAAEPVSSELIASKYELGVRSATVRNEMAEITDLGLLDQPHTSAGRIPSDLGYRFFVDHLVQQSTPDTEDKRTLKKASRDEETLRDLVHETTKALSRMTKLMAAAVTVRDARVRVRNAIVTALGPDRALFIAVLENGHTENRILDCPPGLTLDQIGKANEALDRLAANQTLSDLSKAKPISVGHPTTDQLLSSATNALKNIARDLTRGYLILEGEEYVLSQPEFQREPTALQKIVNSLADEDALRGEVSATKPTGQTVTIGTENSVEPHYPLTFMRQSFTVGEQEAGIIAIIGPTRMNYSRNMGLLDYTANSISHVLTKLLRPGS